MSSKINTKAEKTQALPISNLKSKTYPLSSLPAFPISKRPDNRKNFNAIWEILSQTYPKPEIELDFKTPFELLAATIMSAQCTDVQVNAVTKVLFPKYPTIQNYANADQTVFEKEIYSTGFYHTKAKHIIQCAQIIIEKYDSKVPDTMEELVKLPGVGRKTANIVLARGYGIIDGIAVDTHVKRLSNKLGFTENEDPEKIEKDLMKLADKKDYDDLSLTLIFHGRRVCNAQRPKCDICGIQELCPSAFL
ncbi:Endonuclease III [Methanolapillus millepedarum]|uniref:Endonuclease III n=2 Tax=Methanolapillus millepedarum TaxID=3028296 RepID=A0AA96V1S5_9EURY|nr:Endonuclease III [Methanosarcinaceae archaeon Ac7]